MKKYLIGVAICAMALMAVPQTAGADPVQCSSCVPHFYDTGGFAYLTIPAGTGSWELYMNEPFVAGTPQVGNAYGTGPVKIVVDYPQFCGVIQIDALQQQADGTYKLEEGYRETINRCVHAGTTTTTSPVVTTTTGVPSTTAPVVTTIPVTTTTQGKPPPVVTQIQPPNGPTAPEVAPAPLPNATTGPMLPFTGVNVAPIAALGLSLLALGFYLVRSSNRRLWALRRAAVAAFKR